jgi:hypothetical protein
MEDNTSLTMHTVALKEQSAAITAAINKFGELELIAPDSVRILARKWPCEYSLSVTADPALPPVRSAIRESVKAVPH